MHAIAFIQIVSKQYKPLAVLGQLFSSQQSNKGMVGNNMSKTTPATLSIRRHVCPGVREATCYLVNYYLSD